MSFSACKQKEKRRFAPTVYPTGGALRRVPRRAPLFMAMLTGFSLLGASPLYAASDEEVEALKAEIQRLRQELAVERGEAQQPGAPAVGTQPVVAAPQIDEPQSLDAVVVRSRHRLERLQDVPVSVAVVTGTELERESATDLDAITKRIGNFSWNPGNARTSSLSLRGLGKQSQTDAMDPSVGINVDDVAYSYNPLSSFDLFDVDTIEVLRGPQGTLFGKNAILGVLKIRNKRPTFTPEANYSITFGENQRLITKGAVGGALVDGLLAYRGAFQYDRGNGYIKNRYRDTLGHSLGNTDRAAGRVQFLLTPNPDFDARLSVELAPRTAAEGFNSLYTYTPRPKYYADGSLNTSLDVEQRLGRDWFRQQSSYSYEKDYLYNASVNADHQTPNFTDTKSAAVELNWRVAGYTLTSITGYKDFRFQVRNDDGTPFHASERGGGHVDKFEQYSQEFRIASELGGRVDYQGGLLLLGTKNNYDTSTGFGSDAGAWFASNTQYNRLYGTNDPLTYARNSMLLQNSLNNLRRSSFQEITNKSAALFAQANWHIVDALTLTSGLRFTREDRQNVTKNLIVEQGFGAALNPVAVNGIQMGGFDNDSTGALTAANNTAQLQLADQVARDYFGVDTYNALSSYQKQQVADAKTLRRTNMGVLWSKTKAKSFRKIQPTWLLSPSYKINEDLTTYVSVQYGEKAGIAQTTNGVSAPVKPEKTTSYEVGFKSTLLNKTLILNANAYRSDIRDYQQAVQVLDEYTTNANFAAGDPTTAYTSATGNVDKVQVTGLEIDAVYSGIRNLSLRFSGAYNDAEYKKFPNSARPAELPASYGPYIDVSGQTLPGAAKVSFSLGAEYHRPVFGNKLFHTSFNTFYTSKYKSDNSLSEYSWIKAHSITDFSIGIGKQDRSFDVSLLVKNLFDDDTPLAKTWNSYMPSPPRWIGIVFTGSL
jgi:outer membrane receptor protein involved in Fe transport